MTVQKPTLDLIGQVLTKMDLKYDVDQENETIHLRIGDMLYFIRLNGPTEEVLMTLTRPLRYYSGEAWAPALELSNEWNATALLPKTYVGRFDDGDVTVWGETVWNGTAGISERQLEDYLGVTFGTADQLGEHVTKTLKEFEQNLPE